MFSRVFLSSQYFWGYQVDSRQQKGEGEMRRGRGGMLMEDTQTGLLSLSFKPRGHRDANFCSSVWTIVCTAVR